MTMDAEMTQRLSESGQKLARLAQQLPKEECTVQQFFEAAQAHMQALNEAGIPAESFATAIMSLLTAFGARFNPAAAPGPYLMMLLGAALSGAMAMQMAQMQGDSFAMDHYEAIDAELGPLVLASYRALDGANVLPEGLRAPFESLPAFVDADARFQDKPITHTLAPDILYDIAARLAAMGVIE